MSKGPLLSYRHLEGRAIIAGSYRGKDFARDLGGKYIFGDNATGAVWYLDETTTPASKHILCTVPGRSGTECRCQLLRIVIVWRRCQRGTLSLPDVEHGGSDPQAFPARSTAGRPSEEAVRNQTLRQHRQVHSISRPDPL